MGKNASFPAAQFQTFFQRERAKLEIQNIEIILVARRRPASGLRAIVMVTLQVEEILRLEAIGVSRLVAGKLHKVFLERRRLTAAATRPLVGAVADVVVVVAVVDERGRRRAVLLVDELKLLVEIEQFLSAEAALADRVKLNLAERRRCRRLLRLERAGR